MNAEILKQVEIIFGSVGIILGLFFGLFLLHSRKNQPHSNLFLAIYLLAFSLRIGKSIFHNFYEIDATIRTFFLTILLCVGPSLWLYTKHRIALSANRRFDIFHYSPFVFLLLTFWLIPNDGSSLVFAVFYNALTVHMLLYTLNAFLILISQKEPVRSDEDAKTKKWLYSFLSVNLAFIILYFLISQVVFEFYIGLSFLFSAVVIFFSISALKNPFLFKIPKEKYSNSSIRRDKATDLIERLKALMKDEKPYLDPQLTLAKLSEKMSISTKELSQVINQIENVNYSEFISKQRVEEAKHLLTSPSHAHFTIATIAYECGFNSISSFNVMFKKHTNITAIDYQKSLKA